MDTLCALRYADQERMARPEETGLPCEDRDAELVRGMVRGDEAAFSALLARYQRTIVRLAAAYVKTSAAAEDVAQETWLAVFSSVAAYEGRASFRAWLFRIAVNIAKKRATRDAKGVPFSALEGLEDDEPAVDAQRFQQADARWAGHWASPPEPWSDAEHRLLATETLALVTRAVEDLPPAQRQVMTLRDIQELTSEEVCEILGLSEANQRVLLHRARSKVRAALDAHFSRRAR